MPESARAMGSRQGDRTGDEMVWAGPLDLGDLTVGLT
jgi:hypothetical protein